MTRFRPRHNNNNGRAWDYVRAMRHRLQPILIGVVAAAVDCRLPLTNLMLRALGWFST